MATDHNFIVKNGLEVGSTLIVNSSGQLQALQVVSHQHYLDNVEAKFGNSGDLKIYHTGSNSYIDDAGTGALNIRSSGIYLEKQDGSEVMASFIADGATSFYHNGSIRLNTTTTGIKIDGPSGEATMGAQNTTGFHIYTDRDRFYFNKQISLIDNTLTSYDADLVLKRVGSTKLTLTSGGVSVGGTLTSSGNATFTGTISSGAITANSTGTNTVTIDGTGTKTLRSYHDSGGVGWATGSGTSYTNLLYLDDNNDRVRIYTEQAERLRINATGIDAVTGGFRINATTVIDSSRNLTNIGTISSGAITSTGNITTSQHIQLGSGYNLSWGGTYGANKPTIAGAGGFIAFYPTGATDGEVIRIDADGIDMNSHNLTEVGTINTGQGATEVYLMNQNVRSSDSPTFQDLTVQGNLAITGDINSYNVTDLDVVDKTITLGVGGTSNANNGGGIILDGANAKLTWSDSASRWTMNKSLQFSGTATTTNQAMGVFWPGFDKEATSDYSDNAKIIHTINTGGHAGSVLLIESQNDANDGIAFITNASSSLKHNSSNILTAANFASNVTPVDSTKMPLAGGAFTGAVTSTSTITADTLKLTSDATDTSRHRVAVYDSGATSYGMMLWNTNGTSGDWATMIYGPYQSNRRISFGSVNNSTFSDHGDVTEVAFFDLDDSQLHIKNRLVHYGDTDTYLIFDPDRIRLVNGGNTYLDTNNGSAVLHTGSGLNASNLSSGTVPEARLPTQTKYLRSDAADTATGTITFSGGINVGDLANGGITGSNYNITGVNQLSMNDPGEGINFAGSAGVTLYAIDDSTDSIMNFANATELRVNNSKVWTTSNDGGGSGLDADKLDGIQSSSFLRSDANDSYSGVLSLTGELTLSSSSTRIDGSDGHPLVQVNSSRAYFGSTNRAVTTLATNSTTGLKANVSGTDYTVWHAGNDGSGSGLDADLLDSQHGSYYRNASNINTGTINTARLPNPIVLSGANAIIKLQETGVTNNPTWWTVADGGNYSIRLNNTGTYPISIQTDSDNDAVTLIDFGYPLFIGGTQFIDTSRNMSNIGTISSARLIVNSGANVSQFHSHHTTGHDDWQVSPISIRERGLNTNNSTNNQYSPNLNFHWASVVSRSLTMTSDGNFTLGEWTASGTPEMSGNLSFLNTAGYRVNNTNVIDSSRNLTNIGTISSGAITMGAAALTLNGSLGTWSVNSEGARMSFGRGSANYIDAVHESGYLVFQTSNGETALTLNSSQNATFTGTISSGAITSTGNIVAEDSEVHVGNTDGDNWTRIKHAQADGYGFDWQHDNASVIVNEQGSTNQVLVLGDVDAGNYSGLFGVAHSTNSGTGWTKKLDLKGNGELYIGSSGTNQVYHEGHKPTYSELGTMAYSNLTGTPTFATESYVGTQISNLVDSSPSALNTLNELAAALGDDANFSTTITNSIATKLPKAGGTMSGDITMSGNDMLGASKITLNANPTGTTYGNTISAAPANMISQVVGANDGWRLYGEGASNDVQVIFEVVDDLEAGDTWVFRNKQTYSNYTARNEFIITGEGTFKSRGVGYVETSQRVFADNYHPNADKLTTARTIAGTSFDGTANIDISYDNLTNKPSSIANADTVDSLHASSFLRSDANDAFTGTTLSISGSGSVSELNIGTYGSTNQGILFLNGSSTNKRSTIKTTNGNLHLDPHSGNSMYLNYYTGSGTYFGTGAGGVAAVMGPDGDLWKGSGDNSGSKYWHAGNDGSSSGLDADLLDGQHGTYYNQTLYNSTGNAAGSYLGGHYSSGGTEKPNSGTFGAGKLKIAMLGSSNLGFGGAWNDVLWMSSYNGTDVKRSTALVSSKYDNTSLWIVKQNYDSSSWGTEYLVWNAGNDGSGSGLDADLLDGVQLANIARTDVAETFTSNVAVEGNLYIGAGSNDGYFYSDQNGRTAFRSGDFYIQDTVTNYYNYATNQYIGDSSGDNIHFRANVLDGTGWSINGAGKFSTRDIQPEAGYVLMRSNHHSGHLEGSYNNVGGNGTKSNPIYTIGSSYNPAEASLSNMYGIGYTDAGASFISFTGAGGWGMYVAADGDARVWLDGSNGVISSTGQHYVGTNVVWNAGNDGSGSGLDADLLDGLNLHTGRNNEVDKVVRTDQYGYIQAGWINTTSGNNGTTAISRIYASQDGYIRYYTPANFGAQIGSHISYNDLTNKPTIPTNNNQLTNGAGYITGVTNVSGYAGELYRQDNRTISPNELTAGRLKFGFTSWANNNTSTYADFLHMRSYTDASGGNDNLLMFNKSSKNMRLYQQNFGSSTAYSSYVDFWHTGNDGSGSGLDADLLDGAQSAENGASTIHKLASNGYSQIQNWVNVLNSGIYSSSTNGAHFYPNTASSYGTWRINGSRNGYSGIYHSDGGGVVAGMYDSGGNGGEYRQSGVGWMTYFHQGNDCLGVCDSTTSSSYSLYVNGGIYATGDVVAYSDRRAKENIITIDSALEKVNQLRGVYYNKIDNEDKEREIGFIAQEVNEVAPELVTYAEDIDQYGVKYGNTTALLVEAVKELTQQVKDLKQEIEEIKNVK